VVLSYKGVLMPIFEFECTKCAHTFDELFSTIPEVGPCCPICENESKRIEISGCSFSLSGGGWSAHNYAKTPFKKIADTRGNVKPSQEK
jgi:putative FmdB family regulatory protein